MKYIKTELKENYVIITLDRGKANPLNNEMISELRETIKSLEANDEAMGALITGKENFFSAGLDVIELYGFDKKQLVDFWINFSSLIREFAAFRKPAVAAISGHSPAGGCVLALCCDYRVMAEGPYRIGLNEIPVGITLPQIIFNLYAFTLGTRNAYQNLMEGKLLTADEALKTGLVDEVCPFSELLSRAEAKLKLYLSFNSNTWQNSKTIIRRDLIGSLSLDFDAAFKTTLADWWRPDTREKMGALVAGLKK